METVQSPAARRSPRWQTVTGAVVLAILALTFLFSAVSKLASMDALRWALIDAGISNNTLAVIGAYALVILELALGLLLLLRLQLRRIAYPAALALLGLFSAYLVVMIIRQGNAGDCGCFGSWLPMRPVPALLKNAALAAGLVAIRRMGLPEWRAPAVVPMALTAACALVPLFTPATLSGDERLNLAPLYHTPGIPAQPDLRRGKHVIAFMSLGCPHCREAAKIFHRFLDQNPALPVMMILSGPAEASGDFFRETRATNVPHRFVPDIDSFVTMAGQYVPSIYYVNDGRIERRLSYRTMTRAALESWAGR